jgi:predicted DNA-binding transcriptional regulator AlpA
MEEALVGIQAVQKLYGLQLSWWYANAENGTVPSYKLGKYVKFRLSEVETWIQAQRKGPTAGTNGTTPPKVVAVATPPRPKRVRPVVAKPRRQAAAR